MRYVLQRSPLNLGKTLSSLSSQVVKQQHVIFFILVWHRKDYVERDAWENFNEFNCPCTVIHRAFIILSIIPPSAIYTAGEDYTALSQQFTFGPNTSASLCFTVYAATDLIYDDSETLTLKITSSDQSLDLNPGTATVTILDNTGIL